MGDGAIRRKWLHGHGLGNREPEGISGKNHANINVYKNTCICTCMVLAGTMSPGATLSVSLSLLPGLPPPNPAALSGTSLTGQFLLSSLPSLRAVAGAGGMLDAGRALRAQPSLQLCGQVQGPSHLQLLPEAGFVPRSTCLGRKWLLPRRGACVPEGGALSRCQLPPPQGRKTSGSTAKCGCGGNEFPVQRQGRGGRRGQALLGSHGMERGWRVHGHGLRAAFARCPLATELGLAHFAVPLFGKDVNFTEEKLFPGEKLFPRQVSRCLLRQVRSSPELLPPAA